MSLSIEEGDLNAPPPPSAPPASTDKVWFPDLNETQWKIWDDPSPFILIYGERASGKSLIALEKLVRHCYENPEAFALIISPSIRTGVDGLMRDLETVVLARWRYGNRHPWRNTDGTANPKGGELMDGGIGLEYTPPRMDPQTKDKHLWILNMHGGWSKVMVIAIPYEEAIDGRIRGLTPTFIYVDEITKCPGEGYFSKLAAQMGRSANVGGAQQYVASCNPEGPSHWVYKKWFVYPTTLPPDKAAKFKVYHVPIKENAHRIAIDYYDNLGAAYGDAIERARNIDGEWMDRPSGEALFKDHFIESIHVVGNRLDGTGIMPAPGHPIIVGYDPGPVNFSIHFLQLITKRGVLVWTVFDELNYVGKRTLYDRIASDVCMTMDEWCKEMNHQFTFEHIGDEAAFSQVNQGGSFEARDFEKKVAEFRQRVPGQLVRLRPCPKGNESVPARVRTIQTLLLSEQLYISASCHKTIQMFNQITGKRQDPNKYDPMIGFRPDPTSPYRHALDSLSYPIFYYSSKGSGPQMGRTGEERSSVYLAGRR